MIRIDILSDKLDILLTYIIGLYSGSWTAVVINDMSNLNEQHNNILTYLVYSGRHHNVSLFILSQKLNSISAGIRDNTIRFFFLNA